MEAYVDKTRWGVNLSATQLSTQETQVLQNGLNYALPSKHIPIPKIVASIESGIHHLSKGSKATIQASVVNTLKHTKESSVSNISKEQSRALRNLKKDKDIIIVSADKGRAVVVMNTNDYDKKISDLLHDDDNNSKRLSFQTLNSKRTKDDGGQILSFRFAYWSYL